MNEDRGKRELRVYTQAEHMLAQVRGGPEVVELREYFEGKVGQRVHFPILLKPETVPRNASQKAANQTTVDNHWSGANAGDDHEVVQA